MTAPPESTQSSSPAVVEFGGDRGGLLHRLGGWQHPMLPWALAGLGAAAMFGSLIGEWQVVREIPEFEGEGAAAAMPMGIGVTFVWGPAWLVSATLLAVCCGLALAGQPPIRQYARTIGLVLVAVELGILVAATISLGREHLFGIGATNIEVSPGRGVYAAFASVLLIGAALAVARTATPRARPAVPEPRDGSVPEDLVVGPAEPLVNPTDDHTWR